jgi:hypothetical protein
MGYSVTHYPPISGGACAVLCPPRPGVRFAIEREFVVRETSTHVALTRLLSASLPRRGEVVTAGRPFRDVVELAVARLYSLGYARR